MNQNYTSQQLFKLVKRNELIEFKISKENLINDLNIVFNRIVNDEFDFEFRKVSDYYDTTSLTHKLVLRKLNDNIKRIDKDEQSNRRIIIQQVKTLLEETCPMWILKTDIKSFYENIDRNIILSKLQYDSLISYQSILLLNKIFSHPLLFNAKGLPRGVNISSTLSELSMRNFDKWVRRFPGIYYYARFVDDILIFSHSEENIQNIKSQINKNLESGLFMNESKTEIFDGNNIKDYYPLTYLGYSFSTKFAKKDKFVKVSISEKKVNKLKSRITLALLDFIKNQNYSLLENRIKFLTGNFSIRKTVKGSDLKAGIFYNYSQINDFSVLKELNRYLLRALNSKNNSFGKNLSQLLDIPRIKRLSKYSFDHGFKVKSYNSFTFEEMSHIVNCWK